MPPSSTQRTSATKHQSTPSPARTSGEKKRVSILTYLQDSLEKTRVLYNDFELKKQSQIQLRLNVKRAKQHILEGGTHEALSRSSSFGMVSQRSMLSLHSNASEK